ncbi:MAG: carbohydrate binding family 9 domain-containing protein [Bacteroidales bacterium]|nr:MAG: carbohydrate binding family 9 domain-containing protein [Bacteroidales bacterium]
MSNKIFWITFLTVNFLTVNTYAQEPIEVKRVSGKVILDGLSSEEEWNNTSSLPFITYQPVFGAEPSEKTEVLLTYDDKYFYIAGRLFDREPDKMLMTSKKRDVMQPQNEWFGVILDTYNDNENALGFFTTPAGLRTDASVFNDAVGEMPVSSSWNTFWDVATAITDSGWFAEMRIPFSSLRFQENDGKVKMGFITWRYICRKNEIAIFPPIPPDYGDWSSWKPSLANDIIFEGIKPEKPLYITPYILGGFGQENVLNDEETAYLREDNPALEPGMDIKYGLTNNLTLDLTVNTDFAQVEADDQMVNLTRFPLFFPEKRQFFLERSSIFDFNTGGPNTLFYSRRIGLHEGEPVRIFGGARLIGRKGPWDIGAMNMQTAESDSLPTENFGIIRIRRQVLNENTYLGGIMTSRLGMNGNYNITYGMDGIIRMFGDDYLKLVWTQSVEEDYKLSDPLKPSRIFINWEKRKKIGFGYNLSYNRSGEEFNPGMGFMVREDYSYYNPILSYGWLGREKSSVLKQNVILNGGVFNSISENTVESALLNPYYEIYFKSGLYGAIGFSINYENLLDTFEIKEDEVFAEPGDYTFFDFEAAVLTWQSKPLWALVMFNAGSFYDGTRYSVSLSPIWNISSSWEISGEYEYNNVNFPNRSQTFISHIMRLKVLYMLNTKFSVSSFVQYNSAANIILTNFRLRYNPREGNDFYIVYNEGMNTNLNREIPELPGTFSRTVLLKYTYTFSF